MIEIKNDLLKVSLTAAQKDFLTRFRDQAGSNNMMPAETALSLIDKPALLGLIRKGFITYHTEIETLSLTQQGELAAGCG